MNPVAKQLAVAFVAVFAAACARDEANAGAAAPAPDPVGVWNIADAPTAQAGKPVSLEFLANGEMRGYSGCNSIGATYTLSRDGAITLGPVRQTKMFCPGAPMETEQRVTDALSRATRIEAAGSRLTLRDASGATLLTFERAQ